MRITSALLIGLLGACASPRADTPATDVGLDVEPASVVAGESVTLVLANGSPAPIGYNLCASRLERRSGEGWEGVRSDRVCTLEIRSLAAGEEARFAVDLPSDLATGPYRFSTSVERDAVGPSTISSDPFQVGG
jgi:hypothetical protein